MAGIRGVIHPDTASVLAREYEQVAERLARGSNPSPFVSAEDFIIETPTQEVLPRAGFAGPFLKDNRLSSPKGQNKGQSERMSLILDLVRKRKSLSIKEIAAVIKDCSEKTIQRELGALISQGLVRKVGERRWSVYLPA
jgi:hypothetical protein